MQRSQKLVLTLAVVLAFVQTAPNAIAKGPVDKIAFVLPGRQAPIEVTSGAVLDEFNPWEGRFLGPALDSAPELQHGVEVFFYLRNDNGELLEIYGFSYALGTQGGGYIYLPGRTEPGYARNTTTVLHSSEGRWHEAAPAWDVFVATALTAIRPPATGDGGLR